MNIAPPSYQKLDQAIDELDVIHDFNHYKLEFGIKKLSLDSLSVESLTGNNTTGAATAKGVYFWVLNNRIIYVGKSEKPSSTISIRQSSHFTAFRNQTDKEATGKKLKSFMEESELSELVISIFYIPLKKEATICAYESQAIEVYQPILNNT